MTGKNKKKKKTQKSLGRRIWQYTYRTILILWLLSIVHVVILKYIPVYFTPLMVLRSCQSIFDGKAPRNDKTWMPIEQISHNLVVACIASEDNLFLKTQRLLRTGHTTSTNRTPRRQTHTRR